MPPSTESPWTELSAEQREAATSMGFTEADWDVETDDSDSA